jgi:DNA processing protein
MNPTWGARHLYSRKESLVHTKEKIMAVLKPDEAMHLDEIIERLEAEVSSAEIFAALFELELAGRVKQLPGNNFVKAF